MFQSTRPRGARPLCIVLCGCWIGFNPRARGGRDNLLHFLQLTKLCFNPRARGGRDNLLHFLQLTKLCFNPRARGGRDDLEDIHLSGIYRFNPRARGGRDSNIACNIGSRFVSIHAPAGGATFFVILNCNVRKFQSTRPRGARRHLSLHKDQ